ncbi:MAG: Gfo/Idh/MocA family oxidoreductase [Pseudomonadota bacterium]
MIRVAVLGAGIGEQHLQAYAALPEKFTVRLLVDRDSARAKPLADTYNVETTTDIATALGDPHIDLIDICLPPKLHATVTLQALSAGKHVICEKPLATSLAQIDEIRTAAWQSGKSVFPVFQYRWGPALAQLRALMAAGATGRPLAASIETHWARGADYYANGWRGSWAVEQGGAVLCHAIHAHDLLTETMGPVADVSARIDTRVNDIETEDTAAILMRMENGALATSSVCLGAGQDETRLRFLFQHLTATSGTAPYTPGTDHWQFTARDPQRQASVNAILNETPPEPSGFTGFLSQVADAIAGQRHRAVSLEAGAASIALVTAIYHAARTGETVSLLFGTDHPLYSGWQP